MSDIDLDGDYHPIDIAESIAAHHDWDFDRMGADQISMAIEGQWRTYSITLSWSAYDETLRMVCSYEMEPPEDRLSVLFHLLNHVNDKCWSGCFTYWAEQKLMLYRYGLVLAGTSGASPEQVEVMIKTALLAAERYYPAIQLAVWGETPPKEAMEIAIGEAYGRA